MPEATVEQEKTPVTARQRFRERAQSRVNKVLDELATIGKLNSPSYEYTEADVNAIETALQENVTEQCEILRGNIAAEPAFTLPE
ncbi:MAG TPA: hypothetical protein VGF75_02000 [Candidatus Saccharimonadales bacterium]|jgi:hypothetical protein